jgi:hypothetical protein
MNISNPDGPNGYVSTSMEVPAFPETLKSMARADLGSALTPIVAAKTTGMALRAAWTNGFERIGASPVNAKRAAVPPLFHAPVASV